MSNSQMRTPVQVAIDPVTQFNYPSNCSVGIENDPTTGGQIHKIIANTSPTSATVSASNYANAPVGSELVDIPGNKVWWNISGTWKGAAIS